MNLMGPALAERGRAQEKAIHVWEKEKKMRSRRQRLEKRLQKTELRMGKRREANAENVTWTLGENKRTSTLGHSGWGGEKKIQKKAGAAGGAYKTLQTKEEPETCDKGQAGGQWKGAYRR